MNATKRERKLRYLRGLRGEKKHAAVSPVVATLILILIAVAAAAALYLWLVAWQGNITGGIGQPGPASTVSIGGSTSVYPFTQAAANWFEQNNSDVTISVNQGGTGAGMLAVCSGNVNVGEASSLETVAGLQSADGCPQTPGITITTIGYDAVDVITPVANVHGLVSISYDTLTAVYDGASTSAATLVPTTYAGVAVTGVPFAEAPFSTHAALAWSQIPAAVAGATVAGCTGVETVSTVAATGTTAQTGAACAAPDANDYYQVDTAASSCGYTICAGGATGTALVVPVERSDASGTTQTFEARVLGATSATGFATTFTGLGFSGCGSNNLLADCGINVPTTGNGNPGVISAVASNANSIGYASDGLARAPTSDVTCEGVATAACGIGLETPGQAAAVQPALGATGSIAGGIINGGFGPAGVTTKLTPDQSYAGARPFEMVTLQPPTGEVQRFIEFIVDPANNINIASFTGEVSIYSI
jgi:ABC-type phosphate transport system substrate-binding protein